MGGGGLDDSLQLQDHSQHKQECITGKVGVIVSAYIRCIESLACLDQLVKCNQDANRLDIFTR